MKPWVPRVAMLFALGLLPGLVSGCGPTITLPGGTHPRARITFHDTNGFVVDRRIGTVSVWLMRDYQDGPHDGEIVIDAGKTCGGHGRIELRDGQTGDVLAQAWATVAIEDALNPVLRATLSTAGDGWIDFCKKSQSMPFGLVAVCDDGSESAIGDIKCFMPHDPSGHINDQLGMGEGAPTHGMTCDPPAATTKVELFYVDRSVMVPGDSACPISFTPIDWSSPSHTSAPDGLGTRVDAVPFVWNNNDDPLLPHDAVITLPQIGQSDVSAYGWNSTPGCYYVKVTRTVGTSSCSWQSPVVGIDGMNPVTNLDLTRTQIVAPCIGTWKACR